MSRQLDAREAERQAVQAALDQARSPSERNRLGQFATPTRLALEMAELARPYLPARGDIRFLDPGVGSGVFFYAARKVLGARIRLAAGFEIDPGIANEAERLWSAFGLSIRVKDFCAAAPAADADKANLILCNPPYVRHHHLATSQKASLRQEVEAEGFRISGLAGLYCYVLLLAHRWLVEGGIGVWIVPAEFLDVNYGRALKEYLTTRVTLHQLHRFDPEDVQFADALVSSVVAVFVKTPPARGHRIRLTSGGRLLEPLTVHEIPVVELAPAAKWGPRFTCPAVRAVGASSLTVGDLFTVKRGLATGANNFFILPREQARALGLPDTVLRPILPSPRHIPGDCIERTPEGFPVGLPELVLLDCDLPMEVIRKRHAGLARYLERGEREGIPQRYLPAHRPLWYRQEQRPPAPILCTYMGRQNGGRALRFLRNRSEATTPNVYLMLYPRNRLAAEVRRQPELLDRLFKVLTELATELAHGGRVYGGGLNKIEPKELEAMELPGPAQERFGHCAERLVMRDLFDNEAAALAASMNSRKRRFFGTDSAEVSTSNSCQ